MYIILNPDNDQPIRYEHTDKIKTWQTWDGANNAAMELMNETGREFYVIKYEPREDYVLVIGQLKRME